MRFLLMTLILIPIITYSQSIIGIKGGLSKSYAAYPMYGKHLNSPIIGVTYTKLFNKFQLMIEPGYHTKGLIVENFSDRGNFSDELYRLKFNFIECPLTFGYTPLNNKILLGIYIGIATEYLFSAKRQTNSTKEKLEGFSKFNLDYLFGLKSGINLGERIYLGLNLRYGQSIFNKMNQVNYSYYSAHIDFGYKLIKKKNK